MRGSTVGGGGGAYCCGGGSAYCCCWGAYCCSSCAAQRCPWRRLTRLETEVAVPAITAVRAIPRSSPGIVVLLARRLGGVERGDQVLDRDPHVGDHLAAVAAHGRGEGPRPLVLVDDQHGGGAGLDRVGGRGEVGVAEQARG